MSNKNYDRITDIAMLLGIVSAFLYSRIPHEIAIGLAILAGVLGVGAYFYNSLLLRKTEAPDATVANSGASHGFDLLMQSGRDTIAIEVKRVGHIDLFRSAVLSPEEFYRTEKQFALYLEHLLSPEAKRKEAFLQQFWLHHAGRRLRYQLGAKNSLMTPEVELSVNETAGCAAEIIRDLSSDGKEWEFSFNAKDGLRVSRRRAFSNLYGVRLGKDAYADDEDDVDLTIDEDHWKQSEAQSPSAGLDTKKTSSPSTRL